jgi:hypothetical protein
MLGTVNKINKAATQFKEIPKKDTGSKIENKLDMFYVVKFS